MLDPIKAYNILNQCRVELDEDFHGLNSHQVEALLNAADQHNYRKPRRANGSRARYWCAYLQRRAGKSRFVPYAS